jgi:hypothetical protein
VAAASTYRRILAVPASWCRILASTAALRSVFFKSYSTLGTGTVDATDVVGTSS